MIFIYYITITKVSMTIMKCFRITAEVRMRCWEHFSKCLPSSAQPSLHPQPPASWAELGNIENNFKTHLKFCLQPEPSWAGWWRWLGSITTRVSLQ